MKKKVFFIACALLIAAVTIKAYAEEWSVWGRCDNSGGICTARCPGCSSLFEGLDGTGKGTLTRGICPNCGYDFSSNYHESQLSD